jgi:hypothetical protein
MREVNKKGKGRDRAERGGGQKKRKAGCRPLTDNSREQREKERGTDRGGKSCQLLKQLGKRTQELVMVHWSGMQQDQREIMTKN